MAKEITKRVAGAVGTVDDKTLRQDVADTLVVAGGGGLMLYGAAMFIPFVAVWMVLLAALVLGGVIKFRS